MSKLIHRVLCALGIHAYEPMFEFPDPKASGDVISVGRYCPVCDKIKVSDERNEDELRSK